MLTWLRMSLVYPHRRSLRIWPHEADQCPVPTGSKCRWMRGFAGPYLEGRASEEPVNDRDPRSSTRPLQGLCWDVPCIHRGGHLHAHDREELRSGTHHPTY